MNKIPNIKSFSEHGNSINEHIEQVILTEGSTEAAKEMEYVLVDAAGGLKHKKVYKHVRPYAIKALNGKFAKSDTPSIDLGKLILKNARLPRNSGTNRMSKSAPVSSNWRGGNKTPKTDIIIASNKISLKKGSSQIMSGGTAESLSTFEAATNAMGTAFTGELATLADQIETGINNLLPSYVGTQKGGLDTQKYGGTLYQNTKKKTGKIADVKAGTINKDKILVEADKLNHSMTGKFAQLFAGSPEFKKEFVFEAMTGKVKFGGNEGTATHFLVVDFDGSASYHKVTKSSDDYVGTILSQVSPSVKFKSTAVKRKIDGIDTKTGHYRFWSTVGLMYKAAVKTQNEVYDMMNSGELEYLSEGFFDFISRAWNKFKSFVKNLIEKVKNWIKKSVNNMMEYFQLQPNVRFKNQVRW